MLRDNISKQWHNFPALEQVTMPYFKHQHEQGCQVAPNLGHLKL